MPSRALVLAFAVLTAVPAPAQEATPEAAANALGRRAAAAGLSQEAAAKMTGDQLYSILRKDNAADVPAIAYVATVGFFLTVITVVGVALYSGHLKDRERNAVLRLIVERGGQIPPELLTRHANPASDLKWGILLVAFGVGLIALIGLVAGSGWPVGLLPICVGVGYLVVWALGREQRVARAS